MLKLRDGIIELYKKVAVSVPSDVEEALKNAYSRETSPLAKGSMEIILSNISLARTTSRPICQDTGFPVFFIKVPKGISHQLVKETVMEATRIATKKVPLRPNAVDIVTGKNTGDNTGDHFPLIYMDETEDQFLIVDLMLKGGGSENLGQTYKLPQSLAVGQKAGDLEVLAERDFDGVRKCVLDAVFKAQGKGCPPYTIGVAIGGAKDQVAFLSKIQLMRRITDNNPDNAITELEQRILSDINGLGIGVAGLGGETTVIGVKIGAGHRHPASYFVDVSFSCWANRRGRLIW
ncbi:MAG TPA: fumarate hydratase [Nitrospiraceae bacterium]|nr:fumarate hydratase [Nitrospiraceae bacterium]HCL81767.1 fumarate hydratase [Nitrospiraceae bacterium]HCZ12008.1 fumarate hydratase [Nitrospiraceae bacterium]